MSLTRMLLVGCVAGCSAIERGGAYTPGPGEAEPAASQRLGWHPAEGTTSPPLQMEKIAVQDHLPAQVVLTPSGDHLLFRLGDMVCRTAVESGEMDSDIEDLFGGEVDDSIGDRAMVASAAGVRQFLPEGEVDVLVDVPAIDAVHTADGLAYLSTDCLLTWVDGDIVDLGAECDARVDPLVEAGDGVLAVTPQGIVHSTPTGSQIVDLEPADLVAFDADTTMMAAVHGATLRATALDGSSPGWSRALDGTPAALLSNPATGVFGVASSHDGDRVLEVFDGRTGEYLGTLDVSDTTSAFTSASQGPVIAAVGHRTMKMWQLTR